MANISGGMLWVAAAAFTALSVGSGVRVFALRHETPERAAKLRGSLAVWWTLTAVFLGALWLGTAGLAALMCTVGLIALHEFHRIFARRSIELRGLELLVAGLGIAHYCVLVLSNWTWTFAVLPWLVAIGLATVEILRGSTRDYLRVTAGYTWAFVLLILGLSHVVLVGRLSADSSWLGLGSIGWVLFLVLITEMNDISQALVGRKIGRHKIVPAFSPGKTWEGLAGGMIVSVFLSVALAPWLTGLTVGYNVGGIGLSVLSGIIISVGGFVGDLNMSGLKRDAEVKDSSHLLPGMGGMIDRVDSLTVTAPAFYYFSILMVGS